MFWQNYSLTIYVVLPLWLISILLFYLIKKKPIIPHVVLIVSFVILSVFVIQLWINLNRPPFKTLGETRLWYGIFMAVIGYLLFLRWRYKWILAYSLALASVFLIIDIFRPDTYDQTLMPALQSPLFIPHVIVYMFAYALLSVAAIISLKGIVLYYKIGNIKDTLVNADNLVYIGFAFLTFGLLFGALWAKEAWGHYWTWDPKETWAFITWLLYLVYIHFRHGDRNKVIVPLWILAFAMAFLLICWLGINYLPSAQSSVHTY